MESGSKVKQIVPIIEGTILDTQWNKQAKQPEHLVEFTSSDGDISTRWFIESELLETAAPPKPVVEEAGV